ncbi:N-acetyl-gamma-glutamyl-phosphate reductase [Chitinilyticum piscinae]|uniref:N-acetyl-gamma-glutamyl-phosphate reductase n=1 Tax=Chitinilyticum piscinae TaxID=2866724 RepID=A0A8J7FIK5_9NEIS|nr:N-acetyl-gamma-glutamyl-phosphate reductase [Chitinilyticum piscinae]MBE9608082.1 N-acetyl-gamma-glutamyl-phosphate reductase [Chitinilyticum piscinae]
MARIFIDGEHGTTGLQIAERLAGRSDIELLSLPLERRRSVEHRRELLNAADVVILCLPDDAAIESVSMIENANTAVIDASTAHRINPDWVYGFAELAPGQRDKIRASKRIANVGCYATASIALLRPIIESGLLPADAAINLIGVSGYSGGGKALIEVQESGQGDPFAFYALGLSHKHLPEIQMWSGLQTKPVFLPSVGHFPTGMLVALPLHASQLNGSAQQIADCYASWYANERFVHAKPLNTQDVLVRGGFLPAQTLSNTNVLEVLPYASASGEELVLIARLDNLGKGASGSAIQNLNILLGCDEAASLE